MTERKFFLPPFQLPRSKRAPEERARLIEELSLVSGSEWREYDSVLPPIVGYVPEEERGFFSRVVSSTAPWYVSFNPSTERDRDKLHILYERLPGTIRLVNDDLAFIDPGVKLRESVITKAFAKAGEIIGPTPDPHLDSLSYLVSDEYGTYFYPIRMRARYNSYGFGELDEDFLRRPLVAVPAPPFAIVRLGPWNVHSSPTALQDTERTLMLFSTTESSHSIT